MATPAVCAKAPSVDVGVAIGAFVVRLGKNQAGVTISTRHPGMKSLQLESGRLVVKIDLLPDRRPAGRRVASLADQSDRPVGVASSASLTLLGVSQCRGDDAGQSQSGK